MKMKNLILVIIFALLLVFAACGTAKLEAVSLQYSDGVLSFDPVEGAEGYNIVILHGDEVVYEDTVKDTAIDVQMLGVAGNLTVKVNAYKGSNKGEVATLDFTQLSVFEDVVLEAEDFLANFGTGKAQSNFRNNTLAHKGAYVGGIDDAGQGVYIHFLCPMAGTYEFEAHYCTDMPTALNDVWVNGKYQAQFVFAEKTGWGGDRFDAATAKVSITLEKGWNTISVMKNGDASNNWGSYAELDYFVIKGNGQSYNVDDLMQFGVRPAAYRLEAEMASPRKKNPLSGLYECKNPAIVEDAMYQYSNGFLLGGLDNNYDGAEWHFNSPVKAKYQVKIAYAAGDAGDGKQPKPSFIVTQEEVGLSKNVDFNKKTIHTMEPLEYTGWNNVAVAEETVEIVLEAGKNFIYCLKLDGVESGIFQIDYIELIFMEEVE